MLREIYVELQTTCLLRPPMVCFRPMRKRCQLSIRLAAHIVILLCAVSLPSNLRGQTDCEAGDGLLDFTQPKSVSVQDVIRKSGVAESAAKQARQHYTFKQEVLMQTLTGTAQV